MSKKFKYLLIGLAVAAAAIAPAIAIASNLPDSDPHQESGSLGADGDYDPNTPHHSEDAELPTVEQGSIGPDGSDGPYAPDTQGSGPVPGGDINPDGSPRG
jgi:hypothetical protein